MQPGIAVSFAYALFYALSLHEFRKENQLAHERAEALLAFSSAHDFPYFVGVGKFRLGAMLVAQGQIEKGLTQMRQSMDTTLARGLEMLRPIFLIGLAASHGSIGQIEAGLALLSEAVTIMNTTGQRLNEVGLYMLKGLLLLKAGGQKAEEAEECFRQALEVARRQRAKSLELQAAMRLARVWRQQSKRTEAHKVLSEVYTWFTEGFDTKDVQDAKALLAELQP